MYKGMYNKVSIGGPETTLGTAVPRTERLPITEMVTVVEKANKSADEIITGRGANRRNIINSFDVSMELPLQLQASKAMGLLMVSALGTDIATPVQVGGAFVISYTGVQKSCKLTVAADKITSRVGVLGAEMEDSTFGTAGVLTPTTLGALATTVDGYADYTCTKLFGATDTPASMHVIAATQIAGRSAVVYVTSTDSGVYLHRHAPVLTATERPTLSLQADNTGLTFDVCSGAVVDSLEFSADLKGRATVTASVIGTAVSTDTETAVTLPTNKQLKFSGAHIYMGGVNQTFVKSIAVSLENNHSGDEGFGAGSLYKYDHAKGTFAAKGSATVRTSVTTEVEYAKRNQETESSILALFQGENLATDIPEMVLIDIPHIDIMDASKSAGDATIDTEFTWEAVDANSYDQFVTVDMLTKDSAKYN